MPGRLRRRALSFDRAMALRPRCPTAQGVRIEIGRDGRAISRCKGGRLALASHPAQVVSLVVSDVPGDDPAQVASGPTVPDRVSREEARAMVAAWRIDLPAKVADWLAGDAGRAPDPGDAVFAGHEVRVIASAQIRSMTFGEGSRMLFRRIPSVSSEASTMPLSVCRANSSKL